METFMFHISCTSETLARHEPSNVSPLWTKTVFAAGLMLLGGAQASMAGPAAADIPPPVQIAQARTLCSEIVGVDPGDSRFNGCVASLVASLQSAGQEHTVIEARSECVARGLRPGSTELSLCLLNASAVNPKSGDADTLIEGTASGNTRDQPDGPSAHPTSLGNISDREQQACTRTGFDPAFGAFANCIADLQSALQNIDMPTN
jgi:hypothetical protein